MPFVCRVGSWLYGMTAKSLAHTPDSCFEVKAAMRATSGGAEVWLQTVKRSNFSLGMTGIDLQYLSSIQEGDSIRIYSGSCHCKIKAKDSMAYFVILQNKLNKNKLNIESENSRHCLYYPEMAAKRYRLSVLFSSKF